MFNKLTRRQRQVAFAIIFASITLLLLTLVFWMESSSDDRYVPGEEIQGLTSDLARDLPENYPAVTFRNVSEEAGIQFTHYGSKRTTQLPEDMGSGAAWGDFNNDGWDDLFVVNFSGALSQNPEELSQNPFRSALFRNNGDGSFTNVAESAGLDLPAWGNAAAWGDINNDGWTDLIVTTFGHNYLFKNNADGTFTDISQSSRIGQQTGYWAGASWGDFNKDSFIDLYICGYVEYTAKETGKMTLQYNTEVPSSINPSSFPPLNNMLFLNNGDETFTEVAVEAGVQNGSGRSLAAAWCDFDEDGWQDLYVANDVSDNVLFRNLGNSRFEEISYQAFVADYRGAMGIAIGDWDRDTDLDMFITHWMAQENALYNNLIAQGRVLKTEASQNIRFMDEADRFGLGQVALRFIGFGTSFIDYDNDAYLDLFVVNGSTFQQRENQELLIPMPDQLFWNRGPKDGFYDISAVSGEYFEQEYVGRGAACSDFDKDGDLDIYIANNIGPGILLKNEGGNEKSWIEIKLKGTVSNADGFGARIKIVSGSGTQISEVGAQGSYFSQHSLIQHFGLGNDQKIDSLEITWPSGLTQLLIDQKINTSLVITEEN